MNKKKWIITAAIVVLLGGGGYFGYSYLNATPSAGEEPEMEPPSFPTVTVERGEVKKTIFAGGTVAAKDREEVKPEAAGKIEKLLVSEGQTVKKGDTLFTIDSTDDLLSVQKQELAITRAQKELSEIKDKKDRINADKPGKVTQVLVKDGQTVAEDDVVAKVLDTDSLKIVGKFTAYEVEQFHVGQNVKVFMTASLVYLDGTITKIDMTGSKGKLSDGAHDVEVVVKKQGALYPGDKGVVQYTNEKGVLFASQSASEFTLPEEEEIKAGTNGTVDEVLIEKDDVVKKGQMIVKMDVTAAELDLKDKELSLKESLLALEQKKREIAKKRVEAPISGVITKLNVKEGETISGGEAVAIIMDTSSVYFMAAVDEIDIPAIQVGQAVEVYVTAFGNRPFQGKVVEVPKEGTKEDKAVRFEVKVELSESSEMKHGMTGDCDIFIEQKDNVLRLPLNAVEVMEEGKGNVMVKNPENGEPMPKEVEIGVEGADFIEITGGLQEGDEVLMMGGM